MRDVQKMELVVLQDGLLVHEVDTICEKLQVAGIGFKVEGVTAADAGIVDSHKDNWATGLSHVINYFNHGGTSIYMRILVDVVDVERAKAVLLPEPRERTDWKVVVMWVVLGLAVVFFAYSFIQPRDENLIIQYDESFD